MMKLEDWLDDLCVRFIINLPKSELESVERICFQVEEAQWFYEDFIRPLDPSLPSLNLRAFSLKIFQHCSLFSQWSPEHHMSAFAEFLAYKQRVPVRGAIMLNEDMDQVVLVKGWKKGANWSFPRGKINKDENDLDCAVREVYEETGFDIKDAGLVKDEKEMKYIEVTMREQHMRLYVFRGVPMDTHFQPRTRKEISRIEWYKLTDLPTLKKHKHQDSDGQPQAINGNKFYMVAPFLNPLKKWISQQRKTKNRHSLPYLAAPTFSEEISQDEAENMKLRLQQVSSHGPSNLPEVADRMQQEQDPSADLKRMLNINVQPPAQVPVSRPIQAPQRDVAKSSALLALLRSGSTAEMRDVPHTPREQVSFPPQMPRSPQRSYPQLPPVSSVSSPPHFQVSPESGHPLPLHLPSMPTRSGVYPDIPQSVTQAASVPPNQSFRTRPWQEVPNANLQRFAPYQNTGDPQFSRSKTDSSSISAVPPASALPKLTSHTKTLLDAFKTVPSTTASAAPPQGSGMSPLEVAKIPLSQTQTLLDIFSSKSGAAPLPRESAQTSTATNHPIEDKTQAENTFRKPKPNQKQNLMDLLRQPSSSPVATSQPGQPTSADSQPAELAADVTTTTHHVHGSSNREKNRSTAKKQDRAAAPREGETAATVNGPLNQPQFDGITRSTRKVTNGDRRSPVPASKTLYDHRNPTPVKILARPEDTRGSPARSPKLSKVNASSTSPRRDVTPRESKEPPKPFQPQILRRPQTPSTFPDYPKQESVLEAAVASVPAHSPTKPIRERQSQANSHRQALLSLFNNPLQTSQTSPVAQDPGSAISALSASQPIGPLTDAQLHEAKPISTRSAVDNLASTGGKTRPSIEKRQTAAGDKAFLLGYLGRIASREGQ